jgi:hypothetical protein
MEPSSIVAALLRSVNDRITVHAYGDGLLADLPLTYSDGDSVRLLVEPLGAGVRVSDRASAYERLLLADVNTDTGRAAEAIAATVRAAGLANVGGEEDEIATFGPAGDLGTMVLAVAQASIRVAALDGQRSDWPDGLLSELGSVADVEFFSDGRAVESAVRRALQGAAAAH